MSHHSLPPSLPLAPGEDGEPKIVLESFRVGVPGEGSSDRRSDRRREWGLTVSGSSSRVTSRVALVVLLPRSRRSWMTP